MMPEFRTFLSRSLKRKGLSGAVSVAFDGEVLRLTGTNGAKVVVRPGDVMRMRAGVDRANKGGPWFETRLWLKGGTAPLLITVRQHDAHSYADVMAGFAARLSVNELEAGLSGRGRAVLLALLALPAVFALIVWAVALKDQPAWQGLAVLAAPALIFAIALLSTTSWRPRPVADHAEFEAALTGGLVEGWPQR